MKKIIFGVLVLLVLVTSGCSPTYTPFSQQLYDSNRWTESDIQRIQFYALNDIVLKRQVSANSSDIIRGKVKMEGSQQIEEVIIRRGTPGAVVYIPKYNRLGISFEAGQDSTYLMFGPNPAASNQYSLLATAWKGGRGDVTYGGQRYTTPAGVAMIGIDLSKVRKFSRKTKVAKGKKVG